MAAAFPNKICCPHDFEAHSAGLEVGVINPLAIQAMADLGIDISKNNTQAVFDAADGDDLYARHPRLR